MSTGPSQPVSTVDPKSTTTAVPASTTEEGTTTPSASPSPASRGTKRPAPEQEDTNTTTTVSKGDSPSVVSQSGPNKKRQAIEGVTCTGASSSPTTATGNNKSKNSVDADFKATAKPSQGTVAAKAKATASSPPAKSASATTTKGRSSPSGSTTSTDKSSRGLRHFSMMVCQKVEEKGTTTYNEVADELVKKVIAERRKEDPNGKFDEKNIRRRVYDALNVLMAMGIISKEKKEITWNGLPTAERQDLDMLQNEMDYHRYQLQHKKEALKELLTQQVCFRNLVLRNHDVSQPPPDDKIPLPFIVVNTNSSAVIQCDMSRDRTDVMFDFSMPFEINDDNTILKKMGMNHTSVSTLREMLPADLFQYCQTNHLIDGVIGREEPASPTAAASLGAAGELIPMGATSGGADGSQSK
mmetsp:Transcript_4962/g.12613  ORF Transcript_4962/g.12613 Transcript_4962/m.12613 type:complete len:412 (-) Transcript_4962:382-1617(-)